MSRGLGDVYKRQVTLDPFGYVDEEDLALLTEWKDAGKKQNDLTAEQWAQADINGDGFLNGKDTKVLKNYINDPASNPIK